MRANEQRVPVPGFVRSMPINPFRGSLVAVTVFAHGCRHDEIAHADVLNRLKAGCGRDQRPGDTGYR
jgi:hypothetical protein